MLFRKDALFKKASFKNIFFDKEISEKIAFWLLKDKNILFFSGNPGIGKTYFCYAWAKKIVEKYKNNPSLDFLFFRSNKFFSYLREGIKEKKSFTSEISRLCDSNYFVLDDIGSTQNTEWEKKCLYSFLEYRLESEKPTLITSNHFFEQSNLFWLSNHASIEEVFGERITSRLKDKRNTLIEVIDEDKRNR